MNVYKLIFISLLLALICQESECEVAVSEEVLSQIKLKSIVQNIVISNNWNELYPLYSEEYKKGVPEDFFLETIEDMKLKVKDFHVLQAVGYENAGYLIFKGEVSTVLGEKIRYDVFFYTQENGIWVLENFPFLHSHYINFGRASKPINFGSRK